MGLLTSSQLESLDMLIDFLRDRPALTHSHPVRNSETTLTVLI